MEILITLATAVTECAAWHHIFKWLETPAAQSTKATWEDA